MTWAQTPIGSRRIIDVWSRMYSPALRPSRILAAPAKKRSWSTPAAARRTASATGLPVLRVSAATNSSDRRSTASANRSIARLRSDGVESRQLSNAFAAARIASSTSAARDRRCA